MKILIIDWDDASTASLKLKLEALGHEVIHEAVKGNALDQITHQSFDVVFLDPRPDKDARSLILNIKRILMNLPYVVLMSSDTSNTEEDEETKLHNFLSQGANAFLQKPISPDDLEDIINNAQCLIDTVQNLGDESIDFPNAGGVIAKSAFNQLFLTSIDRADRYEEYTYLLHIKISNYFDMLEQDGPYYADLAVAKISSHISNIRRQSDIIGQIGQNEYALLLLRPRSEEETIEAAKRFATEIANLQSPRQSIESNPEVMVNLIKLPMAQSIADHHFVLNDES